jgi:hypothetical protein
MPAALLLHSWNASPREMGAQSLVCFFVYMAIDGWLRSSIMGR